MTLQEQKLRKKIFIFLCGCEKYGCCKADAPSMDFHSTYAPVNKRGHKVDGVRGDFLSCFAILREGEKEFAKK